MHVANDLIVSCEYTLKNDTGTVLEEFFTDTPKRYLHGHRNIVPGLEDALVGLAVGDTFEVAVDPAEGYGPKGRDATQVLPIRAFGSTPEVGAQHSMRTKRGRVLPFWVQAVGAQGITVTRNHPFAGQTLHFSGRIVAICAAEPMELKNGAPGIAAGCGCC
ncbi:MAG: FKBP-type peptidyl-prolyl cis-trans isomerase SlyD [Bradymonadia bacterium]|jgi:FKBP-type peptidyl-prolyl cis-trans isomerase SlyD